MGIDLVNQGSCLQCDDFPVTEKVALQLAGLQAQVALGDPREKSKLEYYTNIDTYLPYRISRTRGDDVWVSTKTPRTLHFSDKERFRYR